MQISVRTPAVLIADFHAASMHIFSSPFFLKSSLHFMQYFFLLLTTFFSSLYIGAARLKGRSSSPCRGKNFIFSTPCRRAHPVSYPMGTGGCFPGGGGNAAGA
jgi:hypothetical protein